METKNFVVINYSKLFHVDLYRKLFAVIAVILFPFMSIAWI